MSDPTAAPIYRFGLFEVDSRTGELRKQDVRLRLRGRPIEILLILVATPGQVVTREELRARVRVGARVGGAVKRNRIKRLLREAFRMGQYELPTRPDAGAEAEQVQSSKFKVQLDAAGRCGFDYVINVRPHEPLAVEEYGRLLRALAALLAEDWERRLAREAAKGDGAAEGRR